MARIIGSGLMTRASAAGNGLLNNLIAYWPLNEAAGANDALDLHTNGLTLTQVSSPGSAAGLVYAGARTFDGTNDYFARAGDDALLSMGDVDCTMAAWVWLENKTKWSSILGKTRGYLTNAEIEYVLAYSALNDRFVFIVSNGTTRTTLLANTFGSPSAQAWNLVVAQHDSVADTISMRVSGGAANSAAWSTGINDSTARFAIGKLIGYSDTGENMYGRLGPVAVWKSAAGGGGVLSAAQLTALYNAGAGLAYSSFTT